MPDVTHTLVRCRGICDGHLSVTGDRDSPAAILIEHHPEGLRVLAIGAAEHVAHHPAAAAAIREDRLDAVLLPGLINAHTHLDLTVIGPRPHDPDHGFVHWVNQIRAGRPTEPAAIAEAVECGVAMSRIGGVVAVGDIAGAVTGAASLLSAKALSRSGMAGVSFIEFFAIGPTQHERVGRAIELVREHTPSMTGRHRLGLQPHAPNTVSKWAYAQAIEAASRLGLPTMTHLAESPEERTFVGEASGPQRGLLEGLGLWTDDVAADYGRGRSPVGHLASTLAGSGMAAVHVNQCSDEDLERLAEIGSPVVYCPRASAYFGAEQHFGPHRYRDMLDAGITVAIGTDSIVNLPAGTDRLSPLDEIRFLAARDGTDPMLLLRMATSHGAIVLGMDEASARLAPGSTPLGIVAVPVQDARVDNPAASILASNTAPTIAFE